MIIPDHLIRDFITAGFIGIDPYEPANVQPSSLDVRLGNDLTEMDTDAHQCINPLAVPQDLMRYRGSRFLYPGEFVLGATLETVSLPSDIVAQLEGKSSLARLGLIVHATAGYIDPGFHGQVTMEMKNIGDLPIELHVGMQIAQLVFIQMSFPAETPYGKGSNAHYQYQRGPTPAKSVR